jgi:hypothetical protein
MSKPTGKILHKPQRNLYGFLESDLLDFDDEEYD